MIFAILKMWGPNSDDVRTRAVERLVSFGGQSFEQAENIVDALQTGTGKQVNVTTINDLDPDDLRQLGRYFQITIDHNHDAPGATTEPIQLKLWTVAYQQVGDPVVHNALVLANSDNEAKRSIVKKIQTFGAVLAQEIRGPFQNGWILTRRTWNQ